MMMMMRMMMMRMMRMMRKIEDNEDGEPDSSILSGPGTLFLLEKTCAYHRMAESATFSGRRARFMPEKTFMHHLRLGCYNKTPMRGGGGLLHKTFDSQV